MRFFDAILFFLAGAIVGVLAYIYLFDQGGSKRDPMPDIKQQVLLERVRKVAKLITVEGEFSNIHEYNDFYWANIGILSKKALVRVKAKVSVGYDLQKANFEVDSVNKVLRVRNLPEPEILSIDHDVEYYDIREGMFNSFTEAELTQINTVIKKRLRESSERGPLMDKARQEGIESLEIIRLLVEQAGWKFEIEGENPPKTQLDSLKSLNIPNLKHKIDSLLN